MVYFAIFLDVFRFDPDFTKNEEMYNEIKTGKWFLIFILQIWCRLEHDERKDDESERRMRTKRGICLSILRILRSFYSSRLLLKNFFVSEMLEGDSSDEEGEGEEGDEEEGESKIWKLSFYF